MNLVESSIGKRLLKREAISEVPALNQNLFSDISSDDEDSDDSDPLVFCASRGVLLNLSLTLLAKTDNITLNSGLPRILV